jgi:hypothetical protein
VGLFDRKSNQSQAQAARELPPNVSTADLADVRALVDQWDSSLGNSDATWATIEMIARRGGFQGAEAALREIVNGKSAEDVTNRPWRWWAEASRVASVNGDDLLVGRIFLFMYLFVNQSLPLMRAGDQMETGLGKPDDTSYWSIARNAAEALGHLPDSVLIHDTATGTVDVANARELARRAAGLPLDDGVASNSTQRPTTSPAPTNTATTPAVDTTPPPANSAPPPVVAVPPPPVAQLADKAVDTRLRCGNRNCSNHAQPLDGRQCPVCFHYAPAS